MNAVITPDYLSTRDVIADPYPAYRQLRDRSPFNYLDLPAGMVPGVDQPSRSWALMKYADVYNVLRDHERFSHKRNPRVANAFPPLVLIFDDPPRHTRLRRLVNNTFTLKRIESLTPWIASVANELLDGAGRDEIDIIERYAIPLPVKVIARLLGIPVNDYEIFKRWSDAFLSLVSINNEERLKSIQDMVGYFGKIALSRRARGAEDLITAMVKAEIEGEKLEEWEVVGFCVLLLVGGNETTTNLIGNMFNLVATRPELWWQLRNDRNLVEHFIEESLRYESPVHRISRTATTDVELSGVRIPAGDLVTVYFAAANRDPMEFPDPDEFRLDRDLGNHVAFGTGIHYCLGAPLARAEARISLNALLDRCSAMKPGQSPSLRQTRTPQVFGFERLPLLLEN